MAINKILLETAISQTGFDRITIKNINEMFDKSSYHEIGDAAYTINKHFSKSFIENMGLGNVTINAKMQPIIIQGIAKTTDLIKIIEHYLPDDKYILQAELESNIFRTKIKGILYEKAQPVTIPSKKINFLKPIRSLKSIVKNYL